MVLGAAMATFGPAGRASAASTPGPNDTIANVDVSAALSLTGLTPAFTLTGVPGDLVTTTTPVTMTVIDNNGGGYNVTVQAAAADLAGTAPNPDTIPIADLLVSDAATPGGTGGFIPVSNIAPVTVYTQATPSGLTGDVITNNYQMRIPNVRADTYSVTLSYVASDNL